MMVQGELVRAGALPAAAGDPTDAQLLKRFSAQGDEAAFQDLVARHGAMVLQVCRRVLQNAHDAEDAFQAAFLVLARKSGTIRRPEQLANWLYGVAHRVASKARLRRERRTAHERQAKATPVAEPALEVAWNEVRRVLDDELERLPQKYRAALVLCYLEGKTYDQAARLLGCPVGSISWRLEKGRRMLHKRLVRRGLTLSIGLLTLLIARQSSAQLPAWLVESTTHSAAVLHLQPAATETLPNAVAELLRGSLDAFSARPWRRPLIPVLAFLMLLAGGLLVISGVWWRLAAPLNARVPAGRGVAAWTWVHGGADGSAALPDAAGQPAALKSAGSPPAQHQSTAPGAAPACFASAILAAGTAGDGRLGQAGTGLGFSSDQFDTVADAPLTQSDGALPAQFDSSPAIPATGCATGKKPPSAGGGSAL